MAAPRAEPDPADPFLGRWDVTLVTPEREASSWIEVMRSQGRLVVRMVGRWGHARVLPKADVVDGHLRFTSPRAEEGRRATDMVFDAVRSGDGLVGTTRAEDGSLWPWRAVRAPALAAPANPRWGRALALFNGKDLAGWIASDPRAKAWSVSGGTLVSPGHGADLRTEARFRDFRLHLEFRCAPGANSGVYLRGRYEVQIEDDPEPEGPSERTAGVYGFLAPDPPPPRIAGLWRSLDITLLGREVTIRLDDRVVIDRKAIPGITGGALDSDEGAPGPLVLQGSESGQVEFRRLVITPAL